MAANNAYRQRESELSVKRVAVQEGPPSSILDSSCGSSRSVYCLADRIQNGLEVKCVCVCMVPFYKQHIINTVASSCNR